MCVEGAGLVFGLKKENILVWADWEAVVFKLDDCFSLNGSLTLVHFILFLTPLGTCFQQIISKSPFILIHLNISKTFFQEYWDSASRYILLSLSWQNIQQAKRKDKTLVCLPHLNLQPSEKSLVLRRHSVNICRLKYSRLAITFGKCTQRVTGQISVQEGTITLTAIPFHFMSPNGEGKPV